MKKIFIFPNINNRKYISFNPYISNLYNSVNPYCTVVNKDYESSGGILSILKFLPRLNYIWFNWIEDLPDKKGGLAQTLILLFIILYCKITSIKIVWTLHNKFSHYKKNRNIKRFLFWLLMKSSDYILTHSSEGKNFARTFGRKAGMKTLFLHHPILNNQIINLPKEQDILIWGSLIPYKGIDKFLEHLRLKNLENRWKIRIIGKIPDTAYKEKLLTYVNSNIQIEDKFLDNEALKVEIGKSKVVLYTYLKDTVLSSGAVMDSIAMGAAVLGPKCGAFLDLQNDGIIETYDNFDHLTEILQMREFTGLNGHRKHIADFIEQNSWKSFAVKISEWLKFK